MTACPWCGAPATWPVHQYDGDYLLCCECAIATIQKGGEPSFPLEPGERESRENDIVYVIRNEYVIRNPKGG